eukprot:COSAG05_NODE_14227_length_403_cov_3.944079_1_plen_57_part_00
MLLVVLAAAFTSGAPTPQSMPTPSISQLAAAVDQAAAELAAAKATLPHWLMAIEKT